MRLLKLPVIVNKKTGQISSYISKSKLPKSIVKQVEDQPKAIRHLLMEFKGVEND